MRRLDCEERKAKVKVGGYVGVSGSGWEWMGKVEKEGKEEGRYGRTRRDEKRSEEKKRSKEGVSDRVRRKGKKREKETVNSIISSQSGIKGDDHSASTN
jgi:hypothetical protein